MLKREILLIFLMVVCNFLSSCVTLFPTSYNEVHKTQGRKISELKAPYMGSAFNGNSMTKSERAFHYSRVGAVEHCLDQKKLPLIVDTVNVSKKFSYTNYSSTTRYVPTFNHLTTYTYAYPSTIEFPKFMTIFRCIDSISSFKAEVELENVSRDIVSSVSKDFIGGVLVKRASSEVELKAGDLILSVEGKRLETVLDVENALFVNKANLSSADIKIIRNNNMETISVGLLDRTANLQSNISKEIEKACSFKRRRAGDMPICSK